MYLPIQKIYTIAQFFISINYIVDIERREPAPHYQESDRSGYDQSSSSANIDPSWLKNAG